jgi:hypothetical protein
MNEMPKQTLSILGTGWLGSALEKELSNAYLVRTSNRSEQSKLNHFKISYPNELQSLQSFLDCDVLIICITPIEELVSFVELILKNIKDKTQIIFASSTSVYGDDQESIDETSLTKPKTPNAMRLVQAEKLLIDKGHTVVRLGGLFGYDRHPGNYLSGRKVKNPDQTVNLIHCDDAVGVIEFAIQNKRSLLNAVCPEHPRKIEYYTQFCRDKDLALPIRGENTITSLNRIIHDTFLKKHYTFKRSLTDY